MMQQEALVGAFPDGEWDLITRMFSTEDQLDFTPEFLAQCSFPPDESQFADVSMAAGIDQDSLFCSWNNSIDSNLHFISQENSNSSNSSGSAFFPTSGHETYFFRDSNHILTTDDASMSMDICVMDDKYGGSFVPIFPAIAETACINEENSDSKTNLDNTQPSTNVVSDSKETMLKRKSDVPELKTNQKKPRVTRVNKSKKSDVAKKNQKQLTPNNNEEEESNARAGDGQSCSSCSSEEDNASQDSNGGTTSDSKMSEALNSNGKTRASRGSATDPQSLYARKRRERINERLRILQNLVPNGTKVDISTMLEEAVHYVKFLQLQIKLLSSDDLWMYAPIAYNGVDVGLNKKLSMLL